MSTNFYWKVEKQILPTGDEVEYERMDPAVHIGKRSAAGLFCWDCGVTLCSGGISKVHHGYEFLKECPKCGMAKNGKKDNNAPALVELGFSPPRSGRPSGVTGACSFSWAQDPVRVRLICSDHLDDELIEDEYGRPLTCGEFLEMIATNCPIEYTDSVGVMFC